MLSLPIPSSLDSLRYDEIAAPEGKTVGQIIDELAAGAQIGRKGAHLDPDLIRGARSRLRGWRPTLVQIGTAATHLQNQGWAAKALKEKRGLILRTSAAAERASSSRPSMA